MLKRRCLVIALSFIVAGTLAQAESNPWRIGLKTAPVDEADTQERSLLLQRTSFKVNVVGATALGTLVQEFRNDGDTDLTAIYGGLAPYGVELLTTELTIDHEIVADAITEPAPEPKPEPRRVRRSRGVRPEPVNVQARVSNPLLIPAGAQVTVSSAFRLDLPFDEGLFRLTLPEVGQGESVSTYVPTDILVTVFHDDPLSRIESPTHNILSGFERDRTWVELAGRDEESRPFELAFALSRTDEHTLLSYVGPEQDGARDVTVVFMPAVEPTAEAIRPRQLLFILDTSGSMRGDKLEHAKLALGSCLDKLSPVDQFNLAEFDAEFTLFQPEPVPAKPPLGAAHQWLKGQQAGGATRLMPALERILEQPTSPEHHRMIVVLTDGGLADEKEALELLEEKLGDARLFVVGIGKGVKQNTILRLSEYGRGSAIFVAEPEELDEAVSGLFDSISQPLAWDLELDWGAADVEWIGTDRIPDLYAGRPVTVRARVRGDLPAEVLLNVTTTEGTKTFIAALPELVDPS